MSFTIYQQINELILNRNKQIEEWFQNEYIGISPLFFTSVDIRDSGSKIAPVDTNVFPAGFNNIATEDMPHIIQLANAFLAQQNIGKKIVLIPESHTRNQFYLDNLQILKTIIQSEDREVEIVDITKLKRMGNRIVTDTLFNPDAIILNNDFSDGAPEILNNIEQKILPQLSYGWYSRTKSKHFSCYQ